MANIPALINSIKFVTVRCIMHGYCIDFVLRNTIKVYVQELVNRDRLWAQYNVEHIMALKANIDCLFDGWRRESKVIEVNNVSGVRIEHITDDINYRWHRLFSFQHGIVCRMDIVVVAVEAHKGKLRIQCSVSRVRTCRRCTIIVLDVCVPLSFFRLSRHFIVELLTLVTVCKQLVDQMKCHTHSYLIRPLVFFHVNH